MRQRSKEFGGDLRVMDAHPGTVVEAVIPCGIPDKASAGDRSPTPLPRQNGPSARGATVKIVALKSESSNVGLR
jgi:hypothetical protein